MSGARRPATDFVPHRPPMLLLDEVGEDTATSVTCYATLRPDCVFLEGDHARPMVAIELVAQASAVYLGLKAIREGRPPRTGVLVGCREAELFAPRLTVGDVLTVKLERLFDEPEVSAFDGEVTRGGEVIARVSLSVVDGDPAAPAAAPEGSP